MLCPYEGDGKTNGERLFFEEVEADWAEAGNFSTRMNTIAALYQKGRTLNESLSVLKAAMSCRGLCSPHVLLPLRPACAN